MIGLARTTKRSSIDIAIAVVLATVAGSSPVFAQQAATASTSASAPRASDTQLQGFSVVLVLGDLQGFGAPDDVPQAARKALTDMRDFLPFKSYKLLDATWVMCCARVGRRAGPPGVTSVREVASVNQMLRGPDDQELELQLRTQQIEGNRISVSFELTVASGSPLEKLTGDVKPREGVHDRTKPIIDSDFTMDVGETVVVGTSSRVKGTKAIIALLTAVPPRTGATAAPRE